MKMKLPPLGTPEWAAAVFSTPPVRNNKGPAKHTHYHQSLDHVTGQYIGGEGRPEHCAKELLKLMRSVGIVRYFKGQPFETDKDEFGAEIIPDFLVETVDGGYIVIEVKTARCVTRDVEQVLEANRKRFAEFGIKYLVWTDHHPLNHATRHNLILMAKSRSEPVSPDEIDEFISYVEGHPRVSLEQIYRDGFDKTVLLHGAHAARLHFRLNQQLGPTTEISTRPILDFGSVYLNAGFRQDGWWAGL